MTESTSQDVLSRFFSGRKFNIPKYQRGYAWQAQQVKDLLNDIEYTFESDGHYSHYFGTVVTCRKEAELVDVIDGQQRLTTVTLFFARLIDELEEVKVRTDNQELKDRLGTQIEKQKDSFVRQHGEYVIQMDKEKKDAYHAILSGTGSNSIDTSTPSERNLQIANDRIADWFDHKRSKMTDGDGDIEDYADYIIDIADTLRKEFELTEYQVENELTAGRMFGVVNDRGSDLNLADKVKSYLVHRAARMDNANLTQNIYETFTKVFEKVVGVDGDSEEINSFMRYHWVMFTGEYAYDEQKRYSVNTIHRRIKNVDRHIPLSTSEDRTTRWIENYLSSIEETADSYQKLMNPLEEVDANGNPSARQYQKYIYVSNLFNSTGNPAFLLSILNRFNSLEQANRILSELEQLGVRAFQICKARSTLFRVKSQQLAAQIQWMGNGDEFRKTFGDSKVEPFNSEPEAVEASLDELRDRITDSGNIDTVCGLLSQEDVMEGTFTTNWKGIRKEGTIRYILFEYENNLRHPEEQLPFEKFVQSEDKSITIEHIWHQDDDDVPESRQDEHDECVNSLGNLAVLSFSQNSEAGNDDYRTKLRGVYSKSDMKHIDELKNHSRKRWRSPEIESRTEDIVQFVRENWKNPADEE